jgi:anti-sigma factor RsiW
MTLLKSNHIQHNLSDFVLDLLPVEEKQRVIHHIAGCADCRAAVQRERQIGRLIYGALNAATRPEPNQFQALMPAIPSRRSSFLAMFAPHRQWAIACLLLIAMMGAFIFGDGAYNGLVRQAVTQPATVSSLYAPGTAAPLTTRPADALFTVSAQQNQAANNNYSVELSNPPAAPLPAAPQVTPAPAATYFQ